MYSVPAEAPEILLCEVAQVAFPFTSTELGLNPPWNQPHVIPFAFSRSPTFCPLMVIKVLVGMVQSSSATDGLGSPITEPAETFPAGFPEVTVAPCVCPAMRFKTPGVEGPKVVPNELSLIA